MIAIILVVLKIVLFIVAGIFFNVSYNFCKFMMKQRNSWTKQDRIAMFLVTIANVCIILVLILILIKDIIK